MFHCNYVQTIYDTFTEVITEAIKVHIPSRMVKMGRHDPDFITPVIKGLLLQRAKLLKREKFEEANRLAEKINVQIKAVMANRMSNIPSPKDLWKLVSNRKKL